MLIECRQVLPKDDGVLVIPFLQKTVAALNSLQTNASVLEQVRKERKARQRSAELIKMHQYLERTGLKVGGWEGRGSFQQSCGAVLARLELLLTKGDVSLVPRLSPWL